MATPRRWLTSSQRYALLGLPFLLSGLLSGCGDGIPNFSAEELAEATVQVKEAYQLQDYEHGVELGGKWVGWAPDALELKAWFVANLAKENPMGSRAVEMAEEMIATHPESAWSSFALAGARLWTYPLKHEAEVLEASEKALDGLPGIIEAVVLRGEALSKVQHSDSALAFLETLPEEIQRNPDVQGFKAMEVWPPLGDLSDSLVAEVVSFYEEILQEHPSHVSTNADAAFFLSMIAGEPEKALSYVERAAASTPSPRVHGELWREIFADKALNNQEKAARIEADVQNVLVTGGDSPARWAALAKALGDVGLSDLQMELEERVLSEAPRSRGAEMILGNRFRALAGEVWEAPNPDGERNLEKRERLAGMLEEFIDRRENRDPELLLEAQWDLFLLQREDPDPDPEILEELARGLVAHMETTPGPNPSAYYAVLATSLAEQAQAYAEARAVVEAGLAELKERVAATEEEEVDPRVEAERAMFAAATGLVLLEEGAVEEAEEELTRARDLDPESYYSMAVLPYSYLYSGNLMEKKAALARAAGEEGEASEFLRAADGFYQEGLRLEYYPSPLVGQPWTNPNETAFESLYQTMHGDLEGFEDYLLAVEEEAYEERKTEILNQRIEDPEPMVAFALETLEGEEVTSESLLGNVLVINFWGTW